MPRGLVDTSGDPFPVKTESPIMRVSMGIDRIARSGSLEFGSTEPIWLGVSWPDLINYGVRIWLPVHKQGSAFLRRGPLPRTIVCFLLMRTNVSRRMRILPGLDSDPQPLFVSGRGS
ncbi:hypothetical protein GW17_00024193 [Ensete ventricosum]|nr:hypothetical protein GW17_00024193 [Ensete ventricosum]